MTSQEKADKFREIVELLKQKRDLIEKQIQHYNLLASIVELGIHNDKIGGLYRGSNPDVVLGIYLKEPEYATKQKGNPSDLRLFTKPVYFNQKF